MTAYTQPYIKPTSFAEVENIYNNTKPMRGKNKGKDVRPIGDRRRDHERVKKISANCYALMNGGYYDDVFGYYYNTNTGQPTLNEIAKLAPVVWRRHKDGTETVTIRNGIGDGCHMSHYSFLDRMIPRGMMWHIHNGKQYICVLNDKQYYLPKCMYVPRSVWDHAKQSGWLNRGSWMRATDDGSALTFLREDHGNKFTLVGDEQDAPKPPRTLVNKKQKAKYKDAMASYLDWISAMAPMLQVDDWAYCHEMKRQVREVTGGSYWNPITPEVMRQVITKQDHPLRLAMAVDFVASYGTIRSVQSDADVKQVKAEYNRWINKTCGFTKTVKG